jgi:hypothetical protein
MRPAVWIALAAAAPACLALGWVVRGRTSASPSLLQSLPTRAIPAADYAAATRPLEGPLSTTARQRLGPGAGSGRAVLILLHARDWRSCEDLGRQLREMLRVTAPGYRVLALVDPAAAGEYRTWMRREHVTAEIVASPPDSVFARPGPVPTPAVLVTHDGRTARGVGHPVRFPNMRIRSFAEELDSLLN